VVVVFNMPAVSALPAGSALEERLRSFVGPAYKARMKRANGCGMAGGPMATNSVKEVAEYGSHWSIWPHCMSYSAYRRIGAAQLFSVIVV